MSWRIAQAVTNRDPRRHVYRSWVNVGVVGLFGAWCIATMAFAIGSPASVAWGVVGYGAAVALVWFWLRATLASVVTGPEGVLVRNPLRTWRIPWSQVVGFRVAPAPLTSRAVIITRTSGREHVLYGLGGWSRFVDPTDRTEENFAESLNRDRDRYSQTAHAVPSSRGSQSPASAGQR